MTTRAERQRERALRMKAQATARMLRARAVNSSIDRRLVAQVEITWKEDPRASRVPHKRTRQQPPGAQERMGNSGAWRSSARFCKGGP